MRVAGNRLRSGARKTEDRKEENRLRRSNYTADDCRMPYQKEMKMLLLAAITNDGSANGKISRVPKDRPGLGDQPKDGEGGSGCVRE